ncbi:hypothetical protein EHV15_26270 [Paenibacillus oralis]|uniref:Uncharacterized protein n=1 Tax=Paenibacillus oralis TaxID=2490856 RepID=A0A3P3U716_9BACL|nr:hypothetical protein [Paenibacillus oralis]RRJ66030.1 hypothetical protein EHV15_26270 [Paenibacillus oralis]
MNTRTLDEIADNSPKYLTKDAIENLNIKLCLPDLGPFSQDYLSEGNSPGDIWGKIRYYLLEDYKIHKNKIIYWALEEENNLKNCFSVTPYMREIIEHMTIRFKHRKK